MDALTIDDVTVTDATVEERRTARREPEHHVAVETEEHGVLEGNEAEERLGIRAVYDDPARARRQAEGVAE